MSLINIKLLIETLKAKGFEVRGSEKYAEVFKPSHTGPKGIWYGGCQYSSCDFVLSDRPRGSYGYNSFFYGPWHVGMMQNDEYVKRMLEE